MNDEGRPIPPPPPVAHNGKIEIIIGNVLRWGVVIAATVVLFGAMFYLITHNGLLPDYHTFRGETLEFRTFGGIFEGAIHGDGAAIIQIGLLLLIATPISRVAISALAFAAEKDYKYVVITLIVFAFLIYGFLSGKV